MPTGFFHSNGLTQETMEFSIQDFFESRKNWIEKICFSWTNRNRLLLFHSLMKNSSIVKNVVSKPCLCPPGCIEMRFVVLRFYSLPLSHMKRPRGCEQQTVSPAEPLVSVQDKISAHSGKALCGFSPCPKISFHWTCISIFSILLAYAFFKSTSGFSGF